MWYRTSFSIGFLHLFIRKELCFEYSLYVRHHFRDWDFTPNRFSPRPPEPTSF